MAKPKFPGRRTGNPAAGAKASAGASAATVTVEPATPKVRTSPVQFFSQVRAEGRKIVWPSRKETWITSVMVFIMVVIAAAFFWGVDFGLGFIVNRLLAIGS
ncbi:MAG TPA: preprotein translocase subunit SecE [Brevundimonas sp.]|jgi:preprotein translocase subunit SecE|uniref:preprotein translocase subunit SecE n=1 Tax=Brevundimonas sp. TaxID=1871086 RepID=UPI002DF5BAB3|nr:preprotein translocase subunit SecE [Brevundimonas sp.]